MQIKKVVLLLSAVIMMIVLFFGSMMLLTRHIYERQDCKAFNIDNIELRTGIDIPKVISSKCECSDHRKNAEFVLDLDQLDITDYLSKNKLERAESRYIRAGENHNTKWSANYDSLQATLAVEIEYLD